MKPVDKTDVLETGGMQVNVFEKVQNPQTGVENSLYSLHISLPECTSSGACTYAAVLSLT